jgi:hypothetical protein
MQHTDAKMLLALSPQLANRFGRNMKVHYFHVVHTSFGPWTARLEFTHDHDESDRALAYFLEGDGDRLIGATPIQAQAFKRPRQVRRILQHRMILLDGEGPAIDARNWNRE